MSLCLVLPSILVRLCDMMKTPPRRRMDIQISSFSYRDVLRVTLASGFIGPNCLYRGDEG